MKKRLALCLCIFVLSIAAAAQNLELRLPPFSRVQLKNGMTILLMEQHEVPIVSFSIIVKAGSTADPAGKEGLASLTADLLRKGTRNRASEQISTDLDFIGGEFDMSASADFTGGSAEFLKKDILEGMELMADILLNPVFPQEEVTKRVRQRVDEIKAAKDRAESVIGRYFASYLYGRHPYGRPVDGDEASLAAITKSDIQQFYDAHYVPANMILAVSGDFVTNEMRSLLEQRFNAWPSKNAPALTVDEMRPVQGRRLLLIDKPDSTQTYFYIGNVGVNRANPDRVAINVVNTLFGGRFTSRLNTALRVDSGLTYGARSSFDQRRAAGPFTIATYTRNETTGQAIDLALTILADLHEKGITEAELASAKAYIKGQFPTSIETSNQLASTIARLEFYGLDESDIDSYYAKVDAMTLDEARRIIGRYFPKDDLVFVLVGKASEIQPLARKYASTIDTKKITQPGF